MAYCMKCGNEHLVNALFCGNCGTSISSQNASGGTKCDYAKKINNHLIKSILVTIFCCIPFGIAAIVNSASVNTKLQAGDIEGAKVASARANTMGNWSIVLGIAFSVVYFICVISE